MRSRQLTHEVLGVRIIFIPNHIARKCVSAIPSGGSVWMLLPDGNVGTNYHNFKYAIMPGSDHELHIAEKLWRLGKLSKAKYKAMELAHRKKQEVQHLRGLARDLQHSAKRLNLTLTKEQLKLLKQHGAV